MTDVMRRAKDHFYLAGDSENQAPDSVSAVGKQVYGNHFFINRFGRIGGWRLFGSVYMGDAFGAIRR